MGLKDIQVKNAKPRDKQYKLADGDGMFLLVTPSGGKRWILKYRANGKEKSLALGLYPAVSLQQAREKRKEARELLTASIDPSEAKKASKRADRAAALNTFEAVARAWLDEWGQTVTPASLTKKRNLFANDVFPKIGRRPAAEINAPQILEVLRAVDRRGVRFTANRLTGDIARVFKYAVQNGVCTHNPARELQGVIPPAEEKHHAAITDPTQVGAMLRTFDGFSGTFPVHCALKLSPLLFVRPGELRQAEWSQFDLDKAEWRYTPGKTRKTTKIEHIVPLARQAVAILRELHALTGNGKYVFPGARDRKRCMSENTVNAALQRLGFDTQEEITGHGFRAMARTILREDEDLMFDPEYIERQLAHKTKSANGEAYDRAKFLKQRRAMMQTWADYLDALKASATSPNLSPSVAVAPKEARFFLDTEFTSLDQAELISVGIIGQDGNEFYAERSDFNREACSDFVQLHVLPQLGKSSVRTIGDIQLRNELKTWIAAIPLDPPPVLCCDAGGAEYDLPLLYAALGGPLPRGWSIEDVTPHLNTALIENYRAKHGGEHHALHDARANAHAFRKSEVHAIPSAAAAQ